MALSVANILLEVTGDSDDAQRALGEVSRDLALFGRETAEAEADLDTTSATAALDELKARLAQFSADDHSTEINVRIAQAQAEIAVLKTELERLEADDVTIDVDVRRGIVERIGSLSREIDKLDGVLEGASSGGFASFFGAVNEAMKGTAIFGISLRALAMAAPLAIAAVVAIVGQLVAMVASLGSAIAGVGALAAAFGAALIPGIALGIGAILRFKDTADEAGTAAHKLKGAVTDFGDAFKGATGAGADAVFRGLADAMRDLTPLVDALKPAFTRLGEAGGDAFRRLGEQFSSPAWRNFFTFFTDSLAKLTPLFARSFGAFARILANIARAAMPFLISGFRAFADALEGVARKTSDIDGLRNTIGGMMESLKAWGGLFGGLTDLVAAFVQAFAPIGDSIVEALGEGAHNLADWLRSAEGMDKVQQFFEKTGPLAAEIATFILEAAKALIQFGELVAPAVTPLFHALNKVLGVINDVLSALNDSPAAARAIEVLSSPIASIRAAFEQLKPLAEGALEKIKSVASTAADIAKKPLEFIFQVQTEVLGRIRDLWKDAKGIVSDVIKFVFKAPSTVLSAVRGVWNKAKGIIKDVIKFVFNAPSTVLSAVRGVWRSAKGIIDDVIKFVFRAPSDVLSAARGVWEGVKGIIEDVIKFVFKLPGVGGLVSAAKAIWDAINSALPDITIDIHIPTPHVPGFASGVRNLGADTLAVVGEEGPELAFLSQGADIFTASETRRILSALAGGASSAGAVPGLVPGLAGAGAGAGTVIGTQEFHFNTPGTGNPDPRVAMAQAALIQRQKGRR